MRTCCPSCFIDLRPDQWAWRCMNPSCPTLPDTQESHYSGLDVRRRFTDNVPGRMVQNTWQVPRLTCKQCNQPCQQEVCPRCHYELPSEWRNCTTTCIAMAGARSSGKSIYLAVLVRQAQRLAESLGMALTFADARTKATYETHYQAPLYQQRNLMPPTVSSQAATAYHREPLVFRMGVVQGRMHMLVLRDVAGEDLEVPQAAARPFAFFREADAVLFLFDPMRIDAIRSQLAGLVPETAVGAQPLEVLSNLVSLMHGGRTMSAQRLDTPFGLVVSKFDTLHQLVQVRGAGWGPVMDNPGAAFNCDPGPAEPTLSTRDADLLQAEVHSLLTRLQAQSLLNKVEESFSERRLFAVSALGAPPANPEVVNRRGIAPFRVVDPLRWALSRSGVLRVVPQ